VVGVGDGNAAVGVGIAEVIGTAGVGVQADKTSRAKSSRTTCFFITASWSAWCSFIKTHAAPLSSPGAEKGEGDLRRPPAG